jgi:small ligand-binding sensory domain FIST
MIVRAGVTSEADAIEATSELCDLVGGFAPDLAAVWVSPEHRDQYQSIVDLVREVLSPRNLIGCSMAGVIGPGAELERGAGVALWVAKMPGVRVLPFVLDQNDLTNLQSVGDWHDRLGVTPEDIPTIMVLPDPYSIRFDDCLGIMDEAFPGSTIVGGVASGAKGPGQNRLFLNDQVLRQGLVGVTLTGAVRVSTVVSQGCRPIGPTFVITKAESNVIMELGGRAAYSVLRDVHDQADAQEQELMRSGLHVGRVIDEHADGFGPDDFLIRNVAGVVENKGLAVTDYLRAGQTIQFHVRDAATADQDMRSILEGKLKKMEHPPQGGLMFNCNGRGTHLFPEPNHDISLINELIPDCPVAGCFAAGEIGPVGGTTFVHGFTSSLILFHQA